MNNEFAEVFAYGAEVSIYSQKISNVTQKLSAAYNDSREVNTRKMSKISYSQ